MLSTVVMKFIAPSIELIPARCRVKIAQSTAPPVCEPSRLSGGYTVHPVPAPFSISVLARRRIRLGQSSQNEMLLSLGNAISGAPTITGQR